MDELTRGVNKRTGDQNKTQKKDLHFAPFGHDFACHLGFVYPVGSSILGFVLLDECPEVYISNVTTGPSSSSKDNIMRSWAFNVRHGVLQRNIDFSNFMLLRLLVLLLRLLLEPLKRHLHWPTATATTLLILLKEIQ